MSRAGVAGANSPATNPPEAQDGLIVFVRGLHRWTPRGWGYDAIKELLEARLQRCDYFPFDYWGTYWSSADANTVAARLECEINDRVRAGGYKQLYLVGHSFGALLLRQAILNDAHKTEGAEWLGRVERVILLAGANRGFQPYNAWLEHLASLANLLQRMPFGVLRFGRLALQGLRGSDWVTQLRLNWVKRSTDTSARPPLPFSVQILGTRDGLVGPHDSKDVCVAHNSKEILIDDLGHKDLALLNRVDDVVGVLGDAIQEALDAEPKPPPLASPVKHVVFLVHGIRDFAEWHEDLGQSILEVAGKPESVEIVPISYGYFSALQFLFFTSRRRCARSFVDRYVQCFVRHPHAKYSALAHSNGTYALTWAVRENRHVRLENVFLAGSVLPRAYDWENLRPQIGRVRNDCANADWPVGALCWLLSFVPVLYKKELGTAGVDGFEGSAVRHAAPEGEQFVELLGNVAPYRDAATPDEPFVQNNKIHKGGHGAALEPKHHDEIARFLLTGEPMIGARPATRPSWLLPLLYRPGFAVVIVGFAYVLWLIATAGWPAWATTVASAVATAILFGILLLI